MFDFSLYGIQDLFRIRDACVMLARYDLQNRGLMAECNKEIMEREEKFNPDSPEHERDRGEG